MDKAPFPRAAAFSQGLESFKIQALPDLRSL